MIGTGSSERDALVARIEELRHSAGYEAYTFARERVLDMLELEQERMRLEGGAPSAYWKEELAGFEYMFDASPLLVDKLRHHSYHVTGLRHYDYRSHKTNVERQQRRKL